MLYEEDRAWRVARSVTGNRQQPGSRTAANCWLMTTKLFHDVFPPGHGPSTASGSTTQRSRAIAQPGAGIACEDEDPRKSAQGWMNPIRSNGYRDRGRARHIPGARRGLQG